MHLHTAFAVLECRSGLTARWGNTRHTGTMSVGHGGIEHAGAPLRGPAVPRGAEAEVPPALRQTFPDWVWDILAVVVVMILAAPVVLQRLFIDPSLVLLMVFAAVVCAILLLFRREWPIVVLAGSLAILVAFVITGLSWLSAGIAVIIATFTLANRKSQRVALMAGAITTGTVAGLSVAVAHEGVFDIAVFALAAGIAIAGALGDSARSRREYLIAALERAERAEQTRDAEARRAVAEERLRIAQDLHDTVAHNISVISLNAGVASSALDTTPDRAREALGTIRVAARGVLSEIGDLLRYLRSDAEEHGEQRAPAPSLTDLNDLIATMTAGGLKVNSDITGDVGQVTSLADIVAYRVVQEGLTNALKHGSDGVVDLGINVEETTAIITIRNPVLAGGGDAGETTGGLGLTGLAERVAAIRGTIQTTNDGATFELTAHLPLAREQNA